MWVDMAGCSQNVTTCVSATWYIANETNSLVIHTANQHQNNGFVYNFVRPYTSLKTEYFMPMLNPPPPPSHPNHAFISDPSFIQICAFLVFLKILVFIDKRFKAYNHEGFPVLKKVLILFSFFFYNSIVLLVFILKNVKFCDKDSNRCTWSIMIRCLKSISLPKMSPNFRT